MTAPARITLVGAMVTALALARPAAAETVCPSGCDFSTIRSAVESVVAGGSASFTVSGGTYVESGTVVVTGGKTIELIGTGGVTVSNGGNGPVFLVDGAGAQLTVSGMSLTAFNARVLEVVRGGWVALDDDVVYTIGLQSQGGAALIDGSTLEADDTLFLDNVATSGGGHLAAVDAVVTLTDCTFTGGFARRGGALLLNGATATTVATIVGGRFDDNLASEVGGAIGVTGRVALVIDGAVFEENAADVGGVVGDYGAVEVTVEVRDALFTGNRADVAGGVLASEAATWTVEDNRFEQNDAGEGGALWIAGGAVALTRNLLCANGAERGGGVWSRTPQPQVWVNNRMIENFAASGGAVDHGGGTLTLRHTNLLGNRADLGGAVRSDARVDVRNSVVGFTEGSTAVVGSPVVADWNALWGNVAGDIANEVFNPDVVDRDVLDDPRLERYQVGDGCAAADDFYSWYGPLHDGGDEFTRDPDGSRGDLGAFGGASAPLGPWSDVDGDGFPPLYDCVEGDAAIYPEAADEAYDGIDQDCDRRDDFDRDGDGYRVEIDCDDNDPRVNPGAVDRPGEDRDCDEGIDVDGDGYSPPLDCDDEDPRIHPGAVEDLDPTLDLDCTPPADVTRPLEPRTCGGGAPSGGAAWLVAAWLVLSRRGGQLAASPSPPGRGPG
jgi:hypothetical protein